ncbi:hypothetical protein ABIE91_003365 [Bradyrhizobium elkanii]
MVRRVRWYIASVARMERSVSGIGRSAQRVAPDYAALHPGYGFAPYPAGWNESARAIAQASRKRRSWVPASSSPGRSVG